MSWFNRTPEEKIMDELRKQNERKKRNEMINKVTNDLYQNKEIILGVGALAAGAIGAVCKIANTLDRYNTHKIELDRRKQVYDRSTGMYVDLKRPLKNKDWEKIGEMKSQGMKTGEALKKLGLIK